MKYRVRRERVVQEVWDFEASSRASAEALVGTIMAHGHQDSHWVETSQTVTVLGWTEYDEAGEPTYGRGIMRSPIRPS